LFSALRVTELTVHDLATTVREIEKTLAKFRTEGLAVRSYEGE
jgi:hypothetical protein